MENMVSRTSNANNKDLEASSKREELTADAPDLLSLRTDQPYTVFNSRRITFIIFIAAFARLMSPLSAAAYFPALNVLAHDMIVSSASINLTVTTYMIFQNLADSISCRPVVIAGFVVYIAACVGLALQRSFAALMVLPCIQSAATSSTVAISVSVAADLSTPAERGKYMGLVTSGTAMGTAIGPRSIFWFLAVLVGMYMVPLVLWFPETRRNIVGNGSIKAQNTMDSPSSSYRGVPNPLNTLKIMAHKDVALILIYNAIVYTAFDTITASTPYLFGRIYHLDVLKIGFCYISFGVANFLAPLLSGWLLDWNFQRVALNAGIRINKKCAQSMADFPLEKARLIIALTMAVLGALALLCYGWVLEVNRPLAAALLLQFVIGISVTGAFQVMNVVIVDYHPKTPATATAANNLARYWTASVVNYLIILMIDGVGREWCFTFVGLVLLFSSSELLVLIRYGPLWRKARMAKEDL
ncbi:MFS general substrate transporter [Plenodomus tracheiphilus IPT5]|uniref:MFS general substrate transporter n=1 Tax=Plenodomus tracheiphilus IPT5 TaxID=1408161 RepID=A0A6A7B2U0_9PLEO|nr:MFS general substrate transporter [Plenodomus tracheiphilus IPT5]